MEDAVARVRSFNRLVTERVGALEDRYLAGDRPLGEARVLWEIGVDGCDVRALRSRLELDSGYLSRLLRSLEAAGLVAVEQSAADGRVRTARLTRRGLRQRELLDRRSDELARSFLEPLSPARRERLVEAMAEVERLLTAGLVEIADTDPGSPDGRFCLESYFAELARRFEDGFEVDRSHADAEDDLVPGEDVFLVARLRGEPVGCGGLKVKPGHPAELRRMWVSDDVRGLGIGKRLLAELEARARTVGARAVRLETNRALTEAIGLYRASGYYEIPAFNDEAYAHHWFEKALGQPSARKKYVVEQ
jgi:DNA-binding MarR family transcriptional regulator/N-acetylglutamate synthase-like GNAT family acetyltransferase